MSFIIIIIMVIIIIIIIIMIMIIAKSVVALPIHTRKISGLVQSVNAVLMNN